MTGQGTPLSEELRDELAAIDPRSECDRLAELSGLFHTAGSVHLRGRGAVSLHLDLASSAVARRLFVWITASAAASGRMLQPSSRSSSPRCSLIHT